jgi:tRNA pseudouridine55 synthase
MDGILVLLKPPGMTSHDVVNLARRQLGEKRIGHTGTLDPGAAGILVLCVGNATRLIPYMEDHVKAYRAELWFGKSTDTQDAGGEVVTEDRKFCFSDEDLLEAFDTFRGEIEQIPPMVSALKHQGQRLYELARQGKTVERKPRRVRILDFTLVKGWRRGQWRFGDTILFDVVCSKGTYIRTLCQDLGEHLRVPSHMSFLIRTRVGPWSLRDALTLEELMVRGEQIEVEAEVSTLPNTPVLIPMDRGVGHLPGAVLHSAAAKRISSGGWVPVEEVEKWLAPVDIDVVASVGEDPSSQNLLRIYDDQGRFLGIGRNPQGRGRGVLQPARLFPSVLE